jgi:hypothetical protein
MKIGHIVKESWKMNTCTENKLTFSLFYGRKLTFCCCRRLGHHDHHHHHHYYYYDSGRVTMHVLTAMIKNTVNAKRMAPTQKKQPIRRTVRQRKGDSDLKCYSTMTK